MAQQKTTPGYQADGTQGESAARAPFTDPEQHAGAASKLENAPVNFLKKTSPCKKKTLLFLTIAAALSHHNSAHPVHPLHEIVQE